MNKDFTEFQESFNRYKRLFGLTGYTVYFKYEPSDSFFADIQIDQSGMVASVRLSSNLLDKDRPYKDIKRSAKHEALHLLAGRLEQNARYR